MRLLYLIFIWGLLSYVETSRSRRSKDEDNCDCGSRIYKEALIMDGEAVEDIRKYPWIVSVRRLADGGTRKCGGAIISPYWVLTAAHCLEFGDVSTLMIGLKEDDSTEANQFLRVKSFVMHPEYENVDYLMSVHDVGLVETEDAMPCSDFNRPICIPTENIFQEDDEVVIAGWGATNVDSGGLLEGSVKIINNEVCDKLSQEEFEKPADDNNIICTLGNPQVSCNGDSGSPLIANHNSKFYAIGVTAFGYNGGCENTIPVVFMNVASYLSFIKEHVDDLPDK